MTLKRVYLFIILKANQQLRRGWLLVYTNFDDVSISVCATNKKVQDVDSRSNFRVTHLRRIFLSPFFSEIFRVAKFSNLLASINWSNKGIKSEVRKDEIMETKLMQRCVVIMYEKLACGLKKGRDMMDSNLFMIRMKTR